MVGDRATSINDHEAYRLMTHKGLDWEEVEGGGREGSRIAQRRAGSGVEGERSLEMERLPRDGRREDRPKTDRTSVNQSVEEEGVVVVRTRENSRRRRSHFGLSDDGHVMCRGGRDGAPFTG